MKNIIKLAGIVLALAMVFTMGITAFAANVNNTSGHTYNAYQIFKGSQEASEAEMPLGDIEWGDGIKSTEFLAALKADERFKKDGVNIFASAASAEEVAEALAANTGLAEAFANVAAMHLTQTFTVVAESTTLDPGYYLLVDTTDIDGNDARNSALLQVTKNGSVTIAKKYNVPSVDKGIVEGANLVESTDANIGDTVTFRLTGTLPSNYSDYESYKYVFHDDMSDGLTFNSDTVTVKVISGETATAVDSSEYSVVTADLTDGCTFEVVFEDLKTAVPGLTSNDVIVVEYTAAVDSDAVIGSAGNPNTVLLEYSGDPNTTGTGITGKTPEDTVIVFTYELDVTKIDGAANNSSDSAPITLQGAEFILYRGTGENAEYAVVDSNSKITGWSSSKDAAGKLVSDADGLFRVYGLDSGTYYLEETKAPLGYNRLEAPIRVLITATLDQSENNPALTALEITYGENPAVTAEGVKTTDGKYTGTVEMTVENNIGALLPSTGGIGTVIFYVAGGLLAAAAGVLLITKKRMSAEQ